MAEEKDLFADVNRPSGDPESLTDLEKKHVPVITAPDEVKAGECFEVVVEVGKLHEHPNQKAHFIQFIHLYADDVYLARMDFTAETTCPVMKTCVMLDKPFKNLRAFERCNMHGAWEWDKPIAVK